MIKWLEGPSKDEDVVVSTRIRVARNIENYKFPQYINLEESKELTDEILNGMKKISGDDNYRFIRINDLTPRERFVYIEEHLISPNLVQKIDKSSFLLRNDEKVTIMINEEDHIRIQVLMPGLNFGEGWQLCTQIDDLLEENLDYAFNERLGYLTSCPTNVGTGLRASVMVHLPCLAITGHINAIIEALSKIGLTVRGIYGEGSETLGHLFQISNQTTLGEKEESIIKKLNNVIFQVVARERNIRKNLMEKKEVEMEDKIFRSFGLLKYSRLMSSKEAMGHLSNVKLGCEMGIINDVASKEILKLMVEIQPASIQANLNKEMTKEERDINRAQLIRNFL